MRTFKTDRSLLVYILLTIVTCGIYSLVFWYSMISDINEMLYQDGKHTHNILMLWLLSLVTCGIYPFIWYYSVGERLGEAVRLRGIPDTISGSSLLLWMLVGSFLFGIGPFVAFYQIIKATNKLAIHHNNTVYTGMTPPQMQ